jgi:hypothetical protein
MSQRRICTSVSKFLRMMNRSWAFLCFALLICVSAGNLPAQTTNAAINGQITDPKGGVVPGTEVHAVNIDTNVVYPTETNGSGIYAIPALPPGRYRLVVRKDGFKEINKTDITLHVQDILEQNFSLEVGSTSESITVSGADASVINTTNGSVSTVIERQFVENMPLNGRSFQDLIAMTPGVVNQSPQYYATQIVGGGGDFSVNGQRTESNYYTVDGITANISSGNGGGVGTSATGGALAGSTALGTTQTLVPVDALQEFRIQSSTYSAEYGNAPGGQFSFVTRAGTNHVHGSLFNYLRNNYFDANNWFNDHYGTPTPALRQNDFGGTFSGPVFFPHLYDGRDRTFFFLAYEGLRITQPTAASIQYVPDTYMRQQAVAAMQPILNAFPVQNGVDYGSALSPNLAQFITAYSLPSSIDTTSMRLDHTFSPKLVLFFRAGDTPSSAASRPYFALSTAAINAQTYTIGASSQLSDRRSNEFRLGYARSNSSNNATLDSFGGATPINLSAAIGAGAYQQVEPVISIDIVGIGAPLIATGGTANLSRQWNLVDTISLLKGHHTLKFGVDFRHIKSVIAPPQLVPYGVFEEPQTILSGTPDIGLVFSYLQATPLFDQLALFAQDDWRVHARLSLSLGLRWELDPPPTEAHGNDAFTLRGNINDPSTLTLAHRGTPLWDTDWYDFAPRLGAAFIAHNHPGQETIIRAGGGAFFDSADQVAANGFSDLGFSASAIYFGSPLPFTPSQLNVPITVTAPYTSGVISAFPEHLQMPYTLEWNVSLQQALGQAQAMTISYVAAAGRRLLAEQQIDLSSLNPNFGSVQYLPNGVTSNYQALELQFQRSVSKGLQALASYTWSHAIDVGSQSTENVLERGNADFDVRNNLQAGLTWALPTLDHSRWSSPLVNDWGIDGRLFARSAYPITLGGNYITDPSTGNQYNGGLNLVPNVPIYLYGPQYPGGKAINPAAFSLPTAGINGNAPRNFVRGFGETQINLAIRRTFPIHNDLALHFRAETFNLFNHPNFGYVDALYTDATFGLATQMLSSSLGTMASQYQQGGPRSMQFALRLSF